MKLPQNSEELLPTLGAFGMAIGLARLLASKTSLTWRMVLGRAFEGAALAMCAGVLLAIPALKDVPPIALLGAGGLLASLGVSGIISLVRAARGSKE